MGGSAGVDSDLRKGAVQFFKVPHPQIPVLSKRSAIIILFLVWSGGSRWLANGLDEGMISWDLFQIMDSCGIWDVFVGLVA